MTRTLFRTHSPEGRRGLARREMPRLMRAVVSAVLLLVAFTAVPASANHVTVDTIVSVYHGSDLIVSHSKSTACTNIGCDVTVNMGKRDYGRFVRWCASDFIYVIVLSGAEDGTNFCTGPSTWTLHAEVTLRDGADAATTHSGNVTVTLNAAP